MKKLNFTLILGFVALTLNAQWQQDVRLTNDPNSSWLSYNNANCLATDGNNLHVVWWDNRDLNGELYYKRSVDKGLSWQSDVRLTNSSGSSEFPAISANGDNIHIVWMDNRDNFSNYQLYYKKSTDAETNWSEDINLTNEPAIPGIPAIAVSGNTVHVVWHDIRDGNWEIYYKRSTDNGISWQSDVRLTNSASVSERASIVASGNSVYLVWQDERDNDKEIYFKKSMDNGENWSDDLRLTNSTGESQYPKLAVEDSKIYLVWSDQQFGDNSSEIYFKKSDDNGNNWSNEIKVQSTSIASNNPTIAVSSNIIHISWSEVYEVFSLAQLI